jgi:transglutaminase-like putative cysteine protease
VPILVFTTALFVLFPRVGLSLLLLNHPRAGRMIGFSEHVDLGDVGVLRDDPTIALRFWVSNLPNPPPIRLPLHLRGTAFDAYDGHAWARTQRELRNADHGIEGPDVFPLRRSPDGQRDRVVTFDLEPIDPPVVFLPPRAVALRLKPQNQILLGEPLAIQRGADDEVRYSGSDARGLRYDAYLAGDAEPLGDALTALDRGRYLALPASLPERVGQLAHEWTDALPTPEAKARAIEERLRRDFTYDLKSPSQGAPQPVDHFLFESRRGHCEFFSTAMALMLRAVGIPSRNVTGFVGGTWNRFGTYYAVREGDAHSWVEAYIDRPSHPGWQTFDPTPASGALPLEPPTGVYYYLRDLVEALSQSWSAYVVGYDLRKQVRIFDSISRSYDKMRSRSGLDKGPLGKLTRGPVVAAALLGLLAIAYTLWRRRQRRTSEPESAEPKEGPSARVQTATALYRTLEAAMQAQGITRPPSVPPLRHAEDLRLRGHPLSEHVLSLTAVYLETRFGGETLTDASRRDFERRVREIRTRKLEARAT